MALQFNPLFQNIQIKFWIFWPCKLNHFLKINNFNQYMGFKRVSLNLHFRSDMSDPDFSIQIHCVKIALLPGSVGSAHRNIAESFTYIA